MNPTGGLPPPLPVLDPSRATGSIVGMTTSKIAVSVPSDVLTRARAAVRKGHGTSLSAYVSSALDQKLMQDELDELLEEMLAETGGPLTNAELRRAREALGSPAPRARARKS